MIKIQKIERVCLGLAKPGEYFKFKGHPYQYKGAEEYENRAGKMAVIAWIGAPCAVCGKGFLFKTCRNPKWLPKTCSEHRGQSAPRP